MRVLLSITLYSLAFVLSAAPLAAQQTIHIIEYGFRPDPAQANVTVTAAGDSIVVNRTINHQVSDSPDWPHAVEICVATTLIRHGEAVMSSGSCIRTDDDGDQNKAVWWYSGDEGGENRATYFPGTGKYAGMECAWAFQSSVPSGVTGFSTTHAELTCARN